ncbi:hypothetical protein AAG570_002421 [Ranatra chinensis]|uniref:Meiotic nuclear division protein 1 homolog n=1 Tax=Ranatra chinensis TaxID=642074 RepID=A0ABD0Y7Y3_9HEMI
MSKRKGVSAEEKRSRMLEIFYEKKDFFQLKELEKIAPKEKGIVVQSVKDVVQNLVDDGLVDSEKIGTSIYFWAFPSKAKHSRKRKLELMDEKLQNLNVNLKKSRDNVIAAKVGREDTQNRNEVLKENTELRLENERLLAEIKKYKDSDPETLKQLEKEIDIAKAAINRWTDNIFSIKSWCQKKFFIEGPTLDKQFGIPPDLDYIE